MVSPQLKQRSARLFTISRDGSSITCHLCGFTSYDLNHVESRFCPSCLTFHEDRTLMQRLDEGLHLQMVLFSELERRPELLRHKHAA